jgi:hypothetical protein
MKQCVICNKEFKPIDRYHNNQRCCSKDCSKIQAINVRSLYIKSGKAKENSKKFSLSEEGKQYVMKYRRSNNNKISQKKYFNSENGKLAILTHNLRRRAIKKNIIHDFTKEQWKEKVNACNGICPYCNNLFDERKHKLCMDHILAVHWANEYFKIIGSKVAYTIDKVQPMCKSCNSHKNIKSEEELILTC